MTPICMSLGWACPKGEVREEVCATACVWICCAVSETNAHSTFITTQLLATHFEIKPPPLAIGGRMVVLRCGVVFLSPLSVRGVRSRSRLCRSQTRRSRAHRTRRPAHYGAHCPLVPLARLGVHLPHLPPKPPRDSHTLLMDIH